MAVTCFTGAPGSGKSLHLAREINSWLNINKHVIANFEVNKDMIKYPDKFHFIDNWDLSVRKLYEHALKYHTYTQEKATILAIDECQLMFNSREFLRKDRKHWVNFFMQHRKLGFEVFLVTPDFRLVDKQIRSLINFETHHVKVNDYNLALLPFKWFCAVTTVPYNREASKSVMHFIYTKRWAKYYDSYRLIKDIIDDMGINNITGNIKKISDTG